MCQPGRQSVTLRCVCCILLDNSTANVEGGGILVWWVPNPASTFADKAGASPLQNPVRLCGR